MNEKMTKNKIDLCKRNGIDVPEVYNIANAIHNDSDHLKFDAEQNKYIERPMVYKLQNQIIRSIIGHLFGWNGNALTTEVVD